MPLLHRLGPRRRSGRPGRSRAGEDAGASHRAHTLRRSVGIYVLLLALPLLVVLPLLVYSGTLLYVLAAQARESTERELEISAQALAAVVQRELDRSLETLALVAGWPAIAAGEMELERMRDFMLDVIRADLGILDLALVDRDGRTLIGVPQRSATSTASAVAGLDAAMRRAFDSGQPQVSDLSETDPDGRVTVRIIQPVNRDGLVPWIITARLNPDHLAEIMKVQVGDRDAIATVMDPSRRILARTREMDRFFGQYPSRQTLAAMSSPTPRVSRLLTLDGNEYLWAWSITPAGWSVFMGIPADRVDGALTQSISRLGAAGLGLLLLAVAGTVFVARRIARSVDRMAANAPKLLQGNQPPYRPSRIRQLDALYEALQQASHQVGLALSDRDRALSAERAARLVAVDDNTAKDVFIATLSHELRNPLAPVRSAAHILQSPRASEAARARAAAVIDRQVAVMARLLDDLLDLSRIRSNRIELAIQRVSLRSVLQSAIEIGRPAIDARDHRFHCNLPAEDLMLDADPLRLSQVFSNLLTNAAKYTDPGGRIDVWAEVRSCWVEVHVMDTGIGIEPAELEQVFQMFTQVHSPMDRSQGGLGIGLWLVRGLTELHGGRVHAESRGLNTGSEFIVALPLAQAQDPDLAAAAP